MYTGYLGAPCKAALPAAFLAPPWGRPPIHADARTVRALGHFQGLGQTPSSPGVAGASTRPTSWLIRSNEERQYDSLPNWRAVVFAAREVPWARWYAMDTAVSCGQTLVAHPTRTLTVSTAGPLCHLSVGKGPSGVSAKSVDIVAEDE